MPITFRPAAGDDQQKIKELIHRVRINPTNLHWERFIIAEEGGRFVGCAQIKPHGDGVRELASLAVIPERQGDGIGSLLVRAIIEQNPGELYLMCRGELTTYYEQFGFEEIGPEMMPRSFKLPYRAARLLSKLIGHRLAIMRRAG